MLTLLFPYDQRILHDLKTLPLLTVHEGYSDGIPAKVAANRIS